VPTVPETRFATPAASISRTGSRTGGITRVRVYDRAGRGWSESAAAPQDGVRVATDLHTLLQRDGEHGPRFP
jgi:hypothetical protein